MSQHRLKTSQEITKFEAYVHANNVRWRDAVVLRAAAVSSSSTGAARRAAAATGNREIASKRPIDDDDYDASRRIMNEG